MADAGLACLLLGLICKVNGSDPQGIQIYTEQLDSFLMRNGFPARLDIEHSLLWQQLQMGFLVSIQLQNMACI